MPDVPEGDLRALFGALHELHHRAGWPSLRDMAREVGCSHTTISAAFSEARLPRWGLLELIVETLAGDTVAFHQLWLAASRGGSTPPVSDRPATAHVPRDLLADVGAFTGRTGELAELDELLHQRDRAALIVQITGTAGVGKTALAMHWAHRVADRFPDGQLYLDLRGYDPGRPMRPDEALDALLRQVGVDGAAIPADPAQRAARWRTVLADRRLLLVLDNANSVRQVRDLLPGSSSCVVLVTSRDSLPGLVARHGARRLELELLPPGVAVRLLSALVGSRVDAEPDAASALARSCAFLPLALRITAELAVTRRGAALSDLVDELADEPRRLDVLDAGADEHTAIRAVFSWSHRNLDDDAARAFERLGLHPTGDLDPAAAAALFDTDPDDASRLLTTLARAHLVDPRARNRYGMHDLLRAYAAEQARKQPEADRRAARTRLYGHYIDAARGAAIGAAGRAWLDAERVNLIAVARAAADDWPQITVAIAVVLADYLDSHAFYREAQALDEAALAAARAAGDPVAEADLLNLLGSAHHRLGHYQQSGELHAEALELHRRLGERTGEARSRHGLGIVAWRSGRYGEAAEHLGAALELFEAIGDQGGQGRSLYILGVVQLRLGAHEQALALMYRALEINRTIGERISEGRTRNNLGEVYLRLRRHAQAAEQYRLALDVAREVGNHAGEGVALANLATVHEQLGEDEPALLYYQQALAVCSEFGYLLGEADARRGLGVIHSRTGEHRAAIESLRAAVAIGRQIGEAEVQTQALNDLGAALLAAGHPDQAIESYQRALELTRASGDAYEQGRAQAGLAASPGGS